MPRLYQVFQMPDCSLASVAHEKYATRARFGPHLLSRLSRYAQNTAMCLLRQHGAPIGMLVPARCGALIAEVALAQ